MLPLIHRLPDLGSLIPQNLTTLAYKNAPITSVLPILETMVDHRVHLLSSSTVQQSRVTDKVPLVTTEGVSKEYFCGVITDSSRETFSYFHQSEFRNSFVSYLKHLDGEYSLSTWVYRRWLFAPYQLHVILFEGVDNTIYVFAHHEWNSLRHPIKHIKLDHMNGDYAKFLFDDMIDQTELSYLPREMLPECVPECEGVLNGMV